MSPAPASASTGLAGSHSAPPDRAVEPPTYDDFSTINADNPDSWAANAAAMPVPEPTTSRSTAVSATGSPAGIVVLRVVTFETVGRAGAIPEEPS
ncbi:hypothetical protein MINTM008_32000 [Mycobacterium intracellulare]|nr:hypothetical protein MINTM006_29860 [Mycobacterium intracellulare]BCO89524.1 hypothetical protein MINTM015_27810 [Mycobacterium paraintracellulare]BCO68333.1 hypothetical protein MINTM007_29440 [Mycobacterium intracellulare]BCO73865.1 hypothetical protein MINTM008_32000 [Mycobacterium intracellulare]BCO79308.1 hypothetical protein MINTM009_30900 [Mycobacterium intracellulare]